MEETLATCAVDLGGRPYFVFQAEFPAAKIGEFDSELVADFWQAFAINALGNLHIVVHYGRNGHHMAEGIFKSAARRCAWRWSRIRGFRACRAPRACFKYRLADHSS